MHHFSAPRALDVSKGKAADAPAFVARGQEPAGDTPFGRLVSEIAQTKGKADPSGETGKV